jgi:hypothetical protein
MLSKIPQKLLESLTLRDLEDLIEIKRKNNAVSDLMRERDRLRLELKRIEDSIEAMERLSMKEAETRQKEEEEKGLKPSFLFGKRKKNLKDYIAQVLMEAGEPLSPSEIQRRLPEIGYVSTSTNPRSFYNTVFQALQRYEIFQKDQKRYRLNDTAFQGEKPVAEILPKKKTRLKDYIIQVLGASPSPLKVSEIASRVVMEGYKTDLGMDELNQRVSATLKKYLNKDFDWDSQRYRLAVRN